MTDTRTPPPSLAELLDSLQATQLLSAAQRTAITQHLDTPSAPNEPWMGRLLVGIGAWFSAWFMLLFIGMVFSFNTHPTLWLSMGVGLGGIAWWLQRQQQRAVFIQQFGLALMIAAHVLVMFGIFQQFHRHTEHEFELLFASQLLLWFLVYPLYHNDALRVISSVAVLAWAVFILVQPVYLMIVVFMLLWLWQPRPCRRVLMPLAWAVLLMLPVGLLLSELRVVWGSTQGTLQALPYAWPSKLILIVGLLAAVWLFLNHRISLQHRLILAVLLMILGIFGTPSLLAAALLLVVGFALGQPAIQTLAVLFLSYTLWLFYYTLSLTLAEKSILMMLTGLILLAVAGVIHCRYFKLTSDQPPRSIDSLQGAQS
ncbi:MAG: DUF4401 domain-containing protein [Pseudomonadota bacterium]|nr:DUF4401 domain-containing protein [Pseudomonadota bacterium]